MLINPNAMQLVPMSSDSVPAAERVASSIQKPAAGAQAFAVSNRASAESSSARSSEALQAGSPLRQPALEGLDQAITQAKEYIQSVRRDLNLKYDKETGVLVIKVIDQDTQEVVRQVPPEEVLAFIQNMLSLSDERGGMLLREKV